MLATVILYMNREVHMTCKFLCITETEGLLMVTGNHVCCNSGSLLK